MSEQKKRTVFLDQHCALCSVVGVHYVKTKGGFYKICDSCESVLAHAGLLVEPLQVFAQ